MRATSFHFTVEAQHYLKVEDERDDPSRIKGVCLLWAYQWLSWGSLFWCLSDWIPANRVQSQQSRIITQTRSVKSVVTTETLLLGLSTMTTVIARMGPTKNSLQHVPISWCKRELFIAGTIVASYCFLRDSMMVWRIVRTVVMRIDAPEIHPYGPTRGSPSGGYHYLQLPLTPCFRYVETSDDSLFVYLYFCGGSIRNRSRLGGYHNKPNCKDQTTFQNCAQTNGCRRLTWY